MRRHQLAELEDQSWCPRAVRDGGTDWLGFMANATGVFRSLAPKIRAALTATETSHVLDLGSGCGGPWLTLQPVLARDGAVRVDLSDRFPNREAFEQIRDRSGGRLQFEARAIDATAVPPDLDGVRTMFSAFHHFAPDQARAILADAVRQRRGIVIVEGLDRRAVGLLAVPLQVPAIFLFTPFVRPFRWSRLWLTYVLPLIPLLVLIDGMISMLRLYLPDELRALVATVPDQETFSWEIGSTGSRFAIGRVYLVGVPKRPAAGPSCPGS